MYALDVVVIVVVLCLFVCLLTQDLPAGAVVAENFLPPLSTSLGLPCQSITIVAARSYPECPDGQIRNLTIDLPCVSG